MQRKYGDTTRMQLCIDRLQKGDESARKDLLERAQKRLKAYATKMLKSFPLVKGRYDIDALVSDVNARLLVSFKNQRKINDVEHFMYTVAKTIRCQLIDLHRKLKKQSEKVQVQNDSSALSKAKAKTMGPVKRAETTEAASLMHSIIGTLKIDHRQLLEMRFYGGLSLSEIASTLGIPISTIKRRYEDAKKEASRRLNGNQN
ncbi:MAG: RNA polymerase sigma factor [Pirellulales bacterium]|nr:RNA polymerase sigma factor [Pirellulales bacterium]